MDGLTVFQITKELRSKITDLEQKLKIATDALETVKLHADHALKEPKTRSHGEMIHISNRINEALARINKATE